MKVLMQRSIEDVLADVRTHCRELLRSSDSRQAELRDAYKEALKYVEQNKDIIAYDMAVDGLEARESDRQAKEDRKIDKALEKRGIVLTGDNFEEYFKEFEKEADRQRSASIVTTEPYMTDKIRSPERDEPDLDRD
jgi:CheY-like chemotaxis protein